MAGTGTKLWATGDLVTSSAFNTYLQDQVIAVFADSSARDAAYGGSGEPTLAEGMFCMLKDTNEFQIYNGSAWVPLLDADTISVSSGNYIITDAQLSIKKDSGSAQFTLLSAHDTEASTGIIEFLKQDGSIASPAAVDDNASLGRLDFYGYDGNSYALGARIRVLVDGTPADGDMPSEMIFQVTPDGGSETPVTALTIKPTGESRFTTDSDIADFTADNHGVIGLYNSDGAVDDFTCIDWIGNGTQAAARIGMKYTGSGAELHFGTSNNYGAGVNQSDIKINHVSDLLLGYNGTGNDLYLYNDSQLNLENRTASAAGEWANLPHQYGLYVDNVGPGSANNRMWFNGVNGAALYIGPRSSSHTWAYIQIAATSVYVHGALSKASGSFDIKHPTKGGDWRLRHSFIEGPRCDNVYRGQATIENGSVTVDLDSVSDMTDGTWEALNTNGWAMVSSSGNPVTWELDGKTLTIEGPDGAVCSWLVFGERQDQHMKEESPIADDEGKLIVEYENPDAEIYPDDDLPEEEDNEEEN